MQNFEELTPDRIITAVESATGRRLTGMASPFPSYINRVYELQDEEGHRLVAKFYRPGRWSHDALREEHDFVLDCEKNEIPVVAPMRLEDGETLAAVSGISKRVAPGRCDPRGRLLAGRGQSVTRSWLDFPPPFDQSGISSPVPPIRS